MRKYFWRKAKVYLKTYTKQYKDYLTKVPDQDDICLMIHNDNNECVGYIELNYMNERSGSTGIYIEVFKKYRRRGYGLTAMEIMLEYAFEERRLHKVQGCIKSNQKGEENFVYQLGFTFEAYRKNMFIICGNKLDEYYFGMTESQFRNPSRRELLHKKAPYNYMVPILKSSDVLDNEENHHFKYAEYRKEDNNFICNGLLFRGMKMEDYRINNMIIYDSKICRFYDDDVKLPGLEEKIDDYQIRHLNLKLDDARLEFAIEQNGKYIGCVNLCGIDKDNDRFFASIYMIPEYRSKGCGTRAMQFAISYAAKELDCHVFMSCVSDGNIASAKMMKKLGCTMTGIQREAAFVGGKYVDTLFFQI